MKARVLIYNNTFFSVSETFIWEQVDVLRSDFDISLIGNQVENEGYFPLRNLDVHVVNRKDRLVLRYFNFIRRWLRLYTPFEFAEKRDLVRILQKTRPGLVHAHFGNNGVKILPLLKRFGIPLVVSFHGIDASHRIYDQPKYFKRVPALLDYASGIIVVSPHMVDVLKMPGHLRKKVHLIPYSVDFDFFDAGLPQQKNGEPLRILHSGRLVNKKGVPDLIKVFSMLAQKHPNVELHILGGGEEESACKQLVGDLGLGHRVVFYGGQPRPKVRELMTLCHIFVLNSRVAENGDMEGTPVSLLEAMSMRRAVVSTLHAGIPHVVKHEHNGLLVPERSNVDLGNALSRLIVEPQLRMRLGNAARETIVARYNKQRLAEQLSNVYRSVLERDGNA